MKTYKIITEREVTEEQINDLVSTAFEGGINYWCGEAKTSTELGDNYLSEMLTKGATIKLYDEEEEKWHSLTLAKLLKAMGEYWVDLDNYDSDDADALIQTAIFGKVVYG